MQNQVDKTLLFHYFSSRVTAEQKRQIALWLDDDPCNDDFFYRCLEEWEREQGVIYLNPDADFVKLTARIRAELSGRKAPEQMKPKWLSGTQPE